MPPFFQKCVCLTQPDSSEVQRMSRSLQISVPSMSLQSLAMWDSQSHRSNVLLVAGFMEGLSHPIIRHIPIYLESDLRVQKSSRCMSGPFVGGSLCDAMCHTQVTAIEILAEVGADLAPPGGNWNCIMTIFGRSINHQAVFVAVARLQDDWKLTPIDYVEDSGRSFQK